MKSYFGYHGNEEEIVNRACETEEYHVSLGDHHWLGNGSYFFEDTPAGNGIVYAKDWCAFKKHSFPAILGTTITVNANYLFDLVDIETQRYFSELKEEVIASMIHISRRKPKDGCVDGLFFNMWNRFFSKHPLHVIRRSDYYRTKQDRELDIRSRTPNVVVLCVRNTACISKPQKIAFV